ncbi:MAG: hypothetical protein QXU18_10760 [Thermoplasmatales archaeon]
MTGGGYDNSLRLSNKPTAGSRFALIAALGDPVPKGGSGNPVAQ